MPSLLDRLKRRKLVQWALAYLAGAWVVLQLVDVLAEPLGLSMTIRQGLLVVLAIGFVLTLVLAWYHGEKGHQRVSGPELLIIAGVAGLAALALTFVGRSEGSDVVETMAANIDDDRPAVAVLPFDNISPDSGDAYFADGMHEQITSALSKISALRVISRTSVMQYREEKPPSPVIAAELGVGFILEGSARLDGDQVRLTAQLIDATRDEHVWTNEWDRERSAQQLFSLQSEVARQVAFAVGVALTPGERDQVGRVLTDSTRAYLLFLKGNEQFFNERSGSATFDRYNSADSYEDAVAIDQGFALAHARLALSLSYTTPSAERDERIRREAEVALSLLPNLPEGRVALARYFARQGQASDAVLQYQIAGSEDPNMAMAVFELGQLQRQLGEFDEGLQTLQRAEALDPRNPVVHSALARSHTFAHEYDQALDANAKAIALGGSVWTLTLGRAHIHLLKGDVENARRGQLEALKIAPTVFWASSYPASPASVMQRTLTPEEQRITFERYYSSRPEYYLPCDAIGRACLRKAVYEEAVGSKETARIYWDSLRTALDDDPRTYTSAAEGLIYLGLGEEAEALRAAEDLFRQSSGNPYTANLFGGYPGARAFQARVLAHFGHHDQAIDILEEILPAPSWLSVPVLEVDPIWDPLRDHPRFQALLERYSQHN